MIRRVIPALALLSVIAFSATLRLPNLASVPPGLQGDEAAAGLEARRIRTDGWIGVYSDVAGGNPTGCYYLDALTTAVFGESIEGLRVASALLGVATVGVLFVLLRRDFGLTAAIAASAFLSISVWHRIFSRMGHVTIAWPLIVLLATLALRHAVRTGSSAWWAVAGAAFAAGIYFYNGHWLFLAAIGGVSVPIVLTFVSRGQLAGRAVAAFAIAFVVAASPLLTFAATHPDRFVGRAHTVSLFDSPEWRTQTELFGKIHFLARRYVAAWDRLSIHPEATPIDLTGVVPLVTPAALLLSGVGLVLGMAQLAHPAVALGAVVVVVMPMMPALFTDFALRRAFVIAPFIAMFGGIAVAQLMAIARNRRPAVRAAMAIGLGSWVLLIGAQELRAFRTTMVSENTRWGLGPELVEAARLLSRMPRESFVYFYSVRWPLDHEVVRFLAPAVHGETRGAPFASDSLEINPAASEHVFVLLDKYRDRLPSLMQRYPGGQVVTGAQSNGPDGGPSYQAYVLPTMAR